MSNGQDASAAAPAATEKGVDYCATSSANVSTLGGPQQVGIAGHPVQVIDADGKPAFCISDIGEIIGVTNPNALVRNVPERHKLTVQLVRSGQARKMWFVTEPGLYRILFRSNSPVAEKFTDWVTEEVLPAIRKTGFYADPNTRLRVRDYFVLRGICGSTKGYGQTCAHLCRKLGVSYEYYRKWGTSFPISILDKAYGFGDGAKKRTCERGPLLGSGERGCFVFPGPAPKLLTSNS